MSIQLYCGDCLPIMADMPDNSIDLIAVDPPYYKVKNECEWDRQWDTAAGFLAWIRDLCKQWQRILKPNGSLYVFASPKMAARVETVIGRRFNVLNHIVWAKPVSRAQQACKEALRAYFGDSERIIFAEHYGADNIAKGEAGYAAKCDELRGFIFEPLRAYLRAEWQRAGLTPEDANTACNTASMAARHFFSVSQWSLPTAEHYAAMREYANNHDHGGQYLAREYEDLRRPFSVSADVPYTDVWTFPTVSSYAGKHPCEKPLAMMEHIISVSSKPGAVVLDCCCGSGTTGVAAVKLGRSFIGIDKGQHWIDRTAQRIAEIEMQPALFTETTHA
jgi:adenine-specific DNA-methyltransferase